MATVFKKCDLFWHERGGENVSVCQKLSKGIGYVVSGRPVCGSALMPADDQSGAFKRE